MDLSLLTPIGMAIFPVGATGAVLLRRDWPVWRAVAISLLAALLMLSVGAPIAGIIILVSAGIAMLASCGFVLARELVLRARWKRISGDLERDFREPL